MLAKAYGQKRGETMTKRATFTMCMALSGLLLALPPSAQAQPSSAQQDAIRQSCRSDFMANCGGVQPGGQEALQCLQHNVGKLSPACKTAVSATMPPAAAAPAKAPAPAAKTPAKSPPPAAAAAPPPPPAANAAPPPPTVAPIKLRAFIMPQRRLVIVGICGGDVSRLCQGVPPGGERVLKCLAEHAGALTKPCYDALERVSER